MSLLPLIFTASYSAVITSVHLSYLHPRLFHSLAVIEPVIIDSSPQGPTNLAFPSSYRPDFWPSRDAAEAAVRKSKFFRSWDPRVLDKHLEYGLRPTPTTIYPGPEHAGGMTLTTTKHQEAWSFLRSNFDPVSTDPESRSERLRSPDLSPENRSHLFHRPEPVITNQNISYVRPHVLYIFGENSNVNPAEGRDDKIRRTGVGVGGSGGAEVGQVESITFRDGQHMLPLEKTQEVAQILATWLKKQLESFHEVEDWYKTNQSEKSDREMLVLSKTWMKHVRQKENTSREVKGKL